MTTLAPDEFTLPASLEAHDPPEARGLARDGVRMLVSRRASGEVSHHGFGELPGLLLPGDLLVVNTSATLPAQVRVSAELAVHFSGPRPDGSWLTELRLVRGKTTVPNGRGTPGQRLSLPGGAVLTLEERATPRLWRARLSVAVVLITSRSPGSSRPGRSAKPCWLISPDARRLTSIRTPSLGSPRASGGSCASSEAGRVKSSKAASVVMRPPASGARRGTGRSAAAR